MVRRKGEMTKDAIDRGWPHQVAIEARLCTGDQYVTKHYFCRDLSLCPRWTELLAVRQLSGERDYVCEEIAAALHLGIVVIPVLIEDTPLPRAVILPDGVGDLVLHQKHQITYERFGRDVAGLVDAINFARKSRKNINPKANVNAVVAAVVGVAFAVGVAFWGFSHIVKHGPFSTFYSR